MAGDADGAVRLYSSVDGREDEEAFESVGSATFTNDTEGGDAFADPIVSVAVHPSSTMGEARIIVSTRGGKVSLLKGRKDGSSTSLEVIAVLEGKTEGGQKAEYASAVLHPDGLVFAAGTTDGNMVVWDLKTQKIDSTLKCNDDKNSIDSIAFSENGYHLATSSSSSPTLLVWDLRKMKTVATIDNSQSSGDDKDGGGTGNVRSVAFDPDGTHLAYSGEGGTRVCVVKDWDRVVCTLKVPSSSSKSSSSKVDGVGGVAAWGTGGAWLVTGCDGERPTRFWGVESNGDGDGGKSEGGD